ncbi:MAG: RDD family protein [Deltaproteobacteria bacterium]|nr:RDD family protein [Deltaproteobacteria bacterium]
MDDTEKPEEGEGAGEFDTIPWAKAEPIERYAAKAIDFLIVGALMETFRYVGPFAGIIYLLAADGMKGQSPGKRIMGLKTISLLREGGECDFRESALRNGIFSLLIVAYLILGWIPYVGKFLVAVVGAAVVLIEALVVYNDEKGIRAGDRLARTMVVKA